MSERDSDRRIDKRKERGTGSRVKGTEREVGEESGGGK